MKRHLFASRKIFSMLETAYLTNPCYETMRHVAMQMFAEGYKVGKEHAERKLNEAVEKAESHMLSDEAFIQFWDLYDKKVDRGAALKLWNRLSKVDKSEILAYVPLYVKATPDKQYRKNPVTFLRHKSWKDELIPQEFQDRENERRKRTGEAELLAQQLAHFRLDDEVENRR
jgi:hypothetical protein